MQLLLFYICAHSQRYKCACCFLLFSFVPFFFFFSFLLAAFFYFFAFSRIVYGFSLAACRFDRCTSKSEKRTIVRYMPLALEMKWNLIEFFSFSCAFGQQTEFSNSLSMLFSIGNNQKPIIQNSYGANNRLNIRTFAKSFRLNDFHVLLWVNIIKCDSVRYSPQTYKSICIDTTVVLSVAENMVKCICVCTTRAAGTPFACVCVCVCYVQRTASSRNATDNVAIAISQNVSQFVNSCVYLTRTCK